MWVKPYALPANGIVVLKQNEFFQLLLSQTRRSLFRLRLSSPKETFYVSLLLPDGQAANEHFFIIAESHAAKEIETTWHYIMKNIYPTLSLSAEDREQMLQFLKQKFVKEAEHLAEQVIKNESILEFHSLFPTIPSEDCILDYPAVLWRGDSISKGRMYFTSHFLCFAAERGPDRLCVQLARIVAVSRDGLVSFASPLKLTLDDSKTIQFSLPVRPDEIFDVLDALWHLALDEVVLKEEQIFNSSSVMSLHRPAQKQARPTDAAVAPRAQPRNRQNQKVASAEELVHLNQNRSFQRCYRLPDFEKLQTSWTACSLRTSTNECGVGVLSLSKHFLCFSDDASLHRIVVALCEVKEVTVTLDHNGEPAACVRLPKLELFIRPQKGEMLSEMVNEISINWKVATFNHSNKHSSASQYFKEGQGCSARVNDLRRISNASDHDSSRNVARWNQYFQLRGQSFSLIRTSDFAALVRSGVPDELRGFVWQICCGSMYGRMLLESDSYYSSLVAWSQEHESTASDEIERDLNRSLPEHPYYKTEEGIAALRRVLLAYSWHNPALGYCQAMNIIAAMMLLFTSEEATFYLLCTICEVIMPGSYTRALIGAQIDQTIFESILVNKIPEVAAHFRKTNTPLSAITLPWFISLFMGYLPLPAVLRILDSFFLRGLEVLIQAALAVLYLSKNKILAQDDGYIIATMLKDCMWIPTDALLKTMFGTFADIQLHDVQKMRKDHRIQAIVELQRSNKQTQASDLKEKTKYAQAELDTAYSQFKKVTLTNSVDVGDTVDFAQLSEFMTSLNTVWWQRVKQDNQMRIMKLLKLQDVVDPSSQRIGFHQLMVGLWPWLNGDLQARFDVCFSAYDDDADNMLTADELAGALDLLLRISIHPVRGDLTSFVLMLFDKLEVPHSGRLERSRVRSEVIDKPLFVEFFRIR